MAITSIKKALIGSEDINWDAEGGSEEFQRQKSDGQFITMDKINDDKIPTKDLSALTYADGSTNPTAGDSINTVIRQVLADLTAIGIPDGTILEVVSGVLRIAAASITNAKMAANSIDSDQYVDASIDPEHLSADVINSGTLIADNVIDSEHIAAAP